MPIPATEEPPSTLDTLLERWPERYVNADTGRAYAPHHADEARFVGEDGPWRYGLARGGEGGGKSVAGIVKTLDRLRRGMDGIMGSPDLPHFRRSLWPEFRRWCPWSQVVPAQRRRASPEWEPHEPFALTFVNGAKLYCGGFENPGSWEGPNVSFAHWDEARHARTPAMLKVLDGRVRIPGPAGEPPQLYITTTPRKHWLFDYFGPVKVEGDARAAFKRAALVVTLLTADNAPNLAPGFAESRRQSLSEAEARVLLEAEWEDLDDVERFLASMLWWDACREDLPAPDRHTPLTLAADAGVVNDSFGLVGVSRHPQRPNDVAVRLVRQWVPRGRPLDFDEIEREIVALCRALNVAHLAYDAYQLHQMMTRLKAGGVADTAPFSQQGERLVADKQLLDLIQARRLTHDGHPELRQHIDNADLKTDESRTRLRLVKRADDLKIDLAVALSMATARCLDGQVPTASVWDYRRGQQR
jgi:hypothetical protein